MRDDDPQLDWRSISRDWQAEGPPPALRELQPRLARDTRRLAIATAADLIAFALAAFLIITLTMTRPAAGVIAAAAVVLAINAWITAFSVRNRRGSWRAVTATAVGHVALLRARGHAMLRAARAARVVAIMQAIAVVAYVAVSVSNRSAPIRPVALASLLAAALVAGYLRFARRQAARAQSILRECDELEALLRDEGLPADGDREASV